MRAERAVAEQKAAEAARAAGVGARASQLSYVVGGVAAIAGARAIAVGQRLERERKSSRSSRPPVARPPQLGAVLSSARSQVRACWASRSVRQPAARGAASTTRPQVR